MIPGNGPSSPRSVDLASLGMNNGVIHVDVLFFAGAFRLWKLFGRYCKGREVIYAIAAGISSVTTCHEAKLATLDTARLTVNKLRFALPALRTDDIARVGGIRSRH